MSDKGTSQVWLVAAVFSAILAILGIVVAILGVSAKGTESALLGKAQSDLESCQAKQPRASELGPAQ